MPCFSVFQLMTNKTVHSPFSASNTRSPLTALPILFKDGSDSHGNLSGAKANQAVLQQGGVDVTSLIVVNP